MKNTIKLRNPVKNPVTLQGARGSLKWEFKHGLDYVRKAKLCFKFSFNI